LVELLLGVGKQVTSFRYVYTAFERILLKYLADESGEGMGRKGKCR